MYALFRKFGRNWLTDFLDDAWVDAYQLDDDPETGKEMTGLKALAADLGQSQNTLAALRRRFERMRTYGFLKPKKRMTRWAASCSYLEAGNHVVLEFGRYGSDLDAYILVANFLTRRIHREYVERKEALPGPEG